GPRLPFTAAFSALERAVHSVAPPPIAAPATTRGQNEACAPGITEAREPATVPGSMRAPATAAAQRIASGGGAAVSPSRTPTKPEIESAAPYQSNAVPSTSAIAGATDPRPASRVSTNAPATTTRTGST